MSVDLRKIEGTDKVTVMINLDASVVSKLRDKYPEENINEEINFILEQKTFTPNYVLKYKNKTKIRLDVLIKLKKISDLIELQPTYPHLKIQQVKHAIKDVLGSVDDRTLNEFINTVKDCVYSYTGKKLGLYYDIDCSGFNKIVNEKFLERYK